jgi:hypothetical protein
MLSWPSWFDKISYMCYHNVSNSIIWTLLSRGVEGPALRNPGNQGSRMVLGRIVLGQNLDHQTKDQMTI